MFAGQGKEGLERPGAGRGLERLGEPGAPKAEEGSRVFPVTKCSRDVLWGGGEWAGWRGIHPQPSPTASCLAAECSVSPQLVYPSDFRLTDKEVGPAGPWGTDITREEASPHWVSCVSEKQHLLPVLSRLPLR